MELYDQQRLESLGEAVHTFHANMMSEGFADLIPKG